jgi:hypothetical protein
MGKGGRGGGKGEGERIEGRRRRKGEGEKVEGRRKKGEGWKGKRERRR